MDCARCGEPVAIAVSDTHFVVCGRCAGTVRLTRTGVPLWPVPDENDSAGDPPFPSEDARAIYRRAVAATGYSAGVKST